MGVPRTVTAMVMRIVTKFTTVEEFVRSFGRFCTDNTCFIPSAQAKRVGIETGFSIRLADGTPMLRGLCVVLESWSDGANEFARPGVRLGLRKLTPESKEMLRRLRAPAPPPSADETMKVVIDPALLDENGKPTVQMPPLFPDPTVFEEDAEPDSGGIPEPIDLVDTRGPEPITAPVTVGALAAAAGLGMAASDPATPVPREIADETATVPSRAPVMTLLGVAPLEVKPRPPAARVAMVALAPAAEVSVGATPAPQALAGPRKRTWWDRLIGRVRAVIRSVRWAYRRRRGVRASVRRLPTRI